jgi:choline dehydrogenase-like flavoprotein
MSGLVRGERPALTRWEKLLRGSGGLLALSSFGFLCIYAYIGIWDRAQFPYAANSVAKDLMLVALSLLLVWDVRRFATIAVPLIVAAHFVMPILLVATLHGKDHTINHTWLVKLGTPTEFRWGWFAGDMVVVVSFLFMYYRAARSRYDLHYLPPSGYRALMALAEVLVLRKDKDKVVTAAEVGHRVDAYLVSFRARNKGTIKLAFVALAFYPLLTLRPPFHLMSVDARQRWVQRRFLDETRDWLVPGWWRDLRRAMIRAAQQFCFFGYYGDPRAASWAGYEPFSKRTYYKQRMTEVEPNRRGVTCMRPEDIAGESLSTNIVIVGTGAGGATLAHELARQGHDVLMLERGAHVAPEAFTENEADQLSRLYADGALTMSKDFRFRVAQGMCVGGSTVVNNAVCFDLPAPVRARWNGAELEAGLDEVRLEQAFLYMREFLKIAPIGPPERRNPGGQYLVDALAQVPPDRLPGEFDVVDCNIDGCLGSGYCNIGCPWGKKLSALDWTLPKAQNDLKGRVRILPDCRVQKLVMRGAHATGVQARLGDGRRLTVRADRVILSAGAIASSIILQRSSLGQGRAGQSLSFNMASPVTLDFDRELHSECGVQMTHAMYLQPNPCTSDGIVLETWWNPIVSQALFMPGWFEEHWDNMRRYRNMTCLGVVVGSASNGRVKPTLFGEGVKLDYEPRNDDFVRIKEGVRLACQIGLEACALRAMPSTFHVLEVTSERDLRLIDSEIGDDRELSISTSHPQGGNPMSANPEKGVVNPEFLVYGTDNVYVCDASVFPSSITVNPQLTVMALAHYAAEVIGGTRRPCP